MMSRPPVLDPTQIPDQDRKFIKVVVGREPKWGVACPNLDCGVNYHDVRTPDTYFKCLERVGLSPMGEHRLRATFADRRAWYCKNVYRNRLNSLPQDLARLMRGNPDRLYNGLRYVMFLRERLNRGSSAMEVIPASLQETWRAEEFCRQWNRLTNSEKELEPHSLAEVETFMRERNLWRDSLLGDGRKGDDKVAVRAVEPKDLNEKFTLLQLFELRQQADRETIQPKPKRCWWKPFAAPVPQQPIYSELYYWCNNMIASLPPRTAEIYRLFEAIAGDPGLDTPAVRERISQEFARVLAIENALADHANDPMSIVESALESIVGDLESPDSEETPDIVSGNHSEENECPASPPTPLPQSQIN